jgi:hypothetical protein
VDLKARLAALLSQPKATEQWASDVKSLIQKLRPILPGSDVIFLDAKQIPAKTFLRAAADAGSEHRPAEAKKWLATAREFDSSARLEAPVAVVKANPENPPPDETAAANTQAQSQAIESLKQRLQSQADAGDVAGAEKTANSLRAVLAGTIYVAREVPEAVVSAYVRRAKDQHAAGKLHEALQTLAAGARAYGGAADINTLQAKYAQEASEGAR